MKKRGLIVVLVTCLSLLLFACKEDETYSPSNNTSEMQSKTIAGYEYEVPTSWKENGSTDNIYYFYPKNGMLMVGYSEMNLSMSDETVRKDFLDGFASNMGNCEVLEEKEITVANSIAYRQEMEIETDGKNWTASMVSFDCTGGVISFLMTTEKTSGEDYSDDFDTILKSIKNTASPSSSGNTVEKNNENDAEAVRQKLDVRAIPTIDGLICVFVTNKSSTIVDELEVQINYKNDSGETIDTSEDGHDMVLPGSTVVSRMDAPDNYSDFETITSVELGTNPRYENHTNDIAVNSNQGEECIIVEITNNSNVSIDEIEYIAVLYLGNQITTVKYPQDIMDVQSGETVTEKINTYGEEYDRFEIYLNQAHTFGL